VRARTIAKRPTLPPVSGDLRRLCTLLAEEVVRWPDVSVRPMFGLRACYRREVVFAMLPDKRALANPTAIAYKRKDISAKTEGEKWQFCELKNERDMDNALACLSKAYSGAAGRSG
jgi:hypothetical protein